ncbi:MAG: MATE family efflux transporter, partial [Pseudomonadota bacterium]
KELAAAVGFAGTVLFFTFSISIGMTIAASALVAQQLGKGDVAEARRIATSVIVFGLVTTATIALLCWVFAGQLMGLVGAKGDTADLAAGYFRIVVPSLPVAALGIMCSGILRAHGDARRAMTVTLAAGAVNAILDPILIFWVGLGLDGAAWASVAARFAMAITAVYPILRHYGGFAPVSLDDFKRDLSPVIAIAGPAMATNIATPFGSGIVMRVMSDFGDSAVAAFAVIGRLMPLIFSVIFALSGAVGPIIGQNFGAKNYGRVRATLTKAMQFTAIYVGVVWVIMLLTYGVIASAFQLSEGGRVMLFWFAIIVTPLFLFNGSLFISNAAFNNLRRPLFSTALNWGKNTIGVWPFVVAGAAIGGPTGIIVGQALGGVVFGVLGLWLAYRLVDAYEDGRSDPDRGLDIRVLRERAESPFSSPRG